MNGDDVGSGIDYYELQETRDGGAWADVPGNPMSGGTAQVWIIEEPGHTLGYRIRGVDYAGNQEAYPPASEATTRLAPASEMCATPDAYEAGAGDNTASNASPITPGSAGQIHNICNPLSGDWLNDQDWVSFSAVAGERYLLQAVPLAANTAVNIMVYDPDGVTLLASTDAAKFGGLSTLDWISSVTDVVKIKLAHMDGRVIGESVQYRIQVYEGFKILLPVMVRNATIR